MTKQTVITVEIGEILAPWKARVLEFRPVVGWWPVLVVDDFYGNFDYSGEYCADALMELYRRGVRGRVDYADMRNLMQADGWFTCRDYLTPVSDS